MVKYKLTVDEPWGFNHNGSNILHGIVIKQLSPTFLLFKSDSFLDFNGQKSCIPSNPQLSSSASFLRLNVLSSLN